MLRDSSSAVTTLMLLLFAGATACSGATLATTTTLSVSTASVVWPNPVILTATVKAGANPVTPGLVNFCDATAARCQGAALLGQAQLNGNGITSIKLPFPIGTHSIKAVFMGTKKNAASSSSQANVTVTGVRSTSTILGASPTSPYNLMATITGKGAQPLSGTVSFLDSSNGNYSLGSSSLGTQLVTATFAPQTLSGTGSEPVPLAIGDFNGDGYPDIAVGNINPDSTGFSSITLFLSQGTAYLPPTALFLPISANGISAIAAGDFNADGKLDLAITCVNSNNVVIALGNGAGGFTTPTTLATQTSPNGIAAGDFNDDGNADLAVTNQFSSDVTILLGDGRGGFTTGPQSPATGYFPYSVVVGDFNNDGQQDLAIPNYFGNSVTILLGNGDGSFTAAASPNTGIYPDWAAIGDFNNDGNQDLAISNQFSKTITILIGDGKGNFTAELQPPAAGKNPDSVAVADFNADGKQDLVVANAIDGTATILLGMGDGTFPTSKTVPLANGTAPYSAAVADFDIDGRPDFAVAGSGNNTAVFVLNTTTISASANLLGITVPGGGTHNLYAAYAGNSNYGGTTSNAVAVMGTPIPTSTVLSIQPAGTIAVGQTVQITVSISPKLVGGLMPTGTVSFYNGTTLLNTMPVGNGVVAYDSTFGSAVSVNLSAKYSGDRNFLASSSGTVQVTSIPRVSSVTALSVSSGSVALKSIVTLTATVVSGGKAVTQGTVTFCNARYFFCEDQAVLGTAHLTSSGTATIRLVLPAGTTSISAKFGGTVFVTPSTSSTQAITVTGTLSSATTLTVSGQPGDYTFAANVTGSWPPPIGGLTFLDTSNNSLPIAETFVSVSNPQVTQSSSSPVGTGPYSEAVGDFNGDGKPDVAVANLFSNTVTILLGNGNQGLIANASAISGTPNFNRPFAVAVGDFNGDGKQDLAIANSGSNTLTILLGNGNGTFNVKSIATTGTGPNAIAVGDFNGDGKLDLAIANNSGSVTILLGSGDGTFVTAPESPSVGVVPRAIAAADFNGDGRLDLAVVNQFSSTVTILLGNGNGMFTATAASPGAGNAATNVVVADFNGDGVPDLAITDFTGQSVTVLLGAGDGRFTPSPSVTAGLHPSGIAAADMNGDGAVDLIVCDQGSAAVILLLGNGDGTFISQTIHLTAGSVPAAVAVADLNGDGGPDLAIADVGPNVVKVLSNAAVATGTLTGISVPGAGTHQVVAAFSNSPYAASTSNPVRVTATPIPTTTVLVGSTSIIPAGTTVTVSATVSPISADNYALSGTVSLYDGATLLATNALSNGQTVFSAALTTLGTHSLIAKYNGSANFAGDNSLPLAFYVAPASTTSLIISASSVNTGTPVTLTAMVLSSGKPVTAGTVTFCNAAASACLGPAVLGTASLTSNGTASIKLKLGIGTFSIKAVFAGTSKDLASTSTSRTITVKGLHPTTTTLTDAVVAGKYTLTATVKASGLQAPTGNVSFSAATLSTNTTLGTAALGTATAPALSFTALSNFTATATPTAVAVADFNRDGKLDLVVGDGGLIVLLGSGNGTFTEKSANGIGNVPVSIVVGDFNCDGIPDVASVNFVSNSIAILLGSGDGTFTAKPSPATQAAPIAITAGDFNSDGKMDLAVANDASGSVSILLGNGDGTFQPQIVMNLHATLRGIALGDFNQDGRQDLVVGIFGSEAAILLGNGNGTFTSGATVVVGRNPERIVVADFNGDAKPDLALANTGDGTLSIALGNGDGTFGAPSSISLGTGVQPRWLGLGDFNQDGKADLIVTADNQPEALVLLGRGDGTFGLQTTASPTGNPPQFLAVGDFNCDGKPDLGLAVDIALHPSVLLNSLSTSATAILSGVTLPGTVSQSVQATYAGSTVDAASASNTIFLLPM